MQQRLVYLNLFKFNFPITAIISIFHRISGILIFFMIPSAMGILQDTLYYPWISYTASRVTIWLGLTIFIYHLLAGIRHLCMDAGAGEDKKTATITAYLVLVLTVVFSILVGTHLC